MNMYNKLILLVALSISLIQPSFSKDVSDSFWEFVPIGNGGIAVPVGWRNVRMSHPNIALYRSGDGKGLPLLDESGSPLQVGLIVEKFPGSKKTLEEVVNDVLANPTEDPRLKQVGQTKIEEIFLSDGTKALKHSYEFIKEKFRRSLQVKLIVKEQNKTAWVVSYHLVGGKESHWPRIGSKLSLWLDAHLASFCLVEEKFDSDKLVSAYEKQRY